MRQRNKQPLDPAQAHDAALRLLGRREHSARELTAKLRARGLQGGDAEQVVEKLHEAGWQSDARYAELLLRSRVTQGHGRQRIEAEMQMAGIAEAEIRAAFDADDTDWDELCRQVWEKKFGELPASLANRQKQYRFLAGRGFSGSQIGRILKGEPED